MVWPTLGSRTAKEQEQINWRSSVVLGLGHVVSGVWTSSILYMTHIGVISSYI